jgi:hypothetical protein
LQPVSGTAMVHMPATCPLRCCNHFAVRATMLLLQHSLQSCRCVLHSFSA